MGVQKNIRLQGTFGDKIYYHSNGRDLVRSKPGVVRQNEATRIQSAVFGKGAHIASVLRLLLKPVILLKVDRNFRQPFDEAIRQWLRTSAINDNQPQDDLPFITGYQFNKETTVKERLRKRITVDRDAAAGIRVNIPALIPDQQIIAPAHTHAVTIKIVAATYQVTTQTNIHNAGTEIHLPYNNTPVNAQQLVLPVMPATGNLTVVALALLYHTTTGDLTNYSLDANWMPVGIIAAMYN